MLPLGKAPDVDYKTSSGVFDGKKPFATVDFYIANTQLDELTAHYTQTYLLLLQSLGFDTTL